MTTRSPTDIRNLFIHYSETIDKLYGHFGWNIGVFGNFLPRFVDSSPSISEFAGLRQDERIVLGIPSYGDTLSLQYSRTLASGGNFLKGAIASEQLKRSLPNSFQAILSLDKDLRLTVFSTGNSSLVMRVPEYVNMIARDLSSHNLLELQCKELFTAELDLCKLRLDDWPE